jgi:hypothetical protein
MFQGSRRFCLNIELGLIPAVWDTIDQPSPEHLDGVSEPGDLVLDDLTVCAPGLLRLGPDFLGSLLG